MQSKITGRIIPKYAHNINVTILKDHREKQNFPLQTTPSLKL